MKQRNAREQTVNEFVVDALSFSNYGPLAPLFIMECLTKWSAKVAAEKPETFDSPFLCGASWVGVARELKEKLDAFYAGK